MFTASLLPITIITGASSCGQCLSFTRKAKCCVDIPATVKSPNNDPVAAYYNYVCVKISKYKNPLKMGNFTLLRKGILTDARAG